MKFVFHSNCQRVFWGREKRVNEENFFGLEKAVAVLHIKQAQKSSKRDLPTKMGTGIFPKKNEDFIPTFLENEAIFLNLAFSKF